MKNVIYNIFLIMCVIVFGVCGVLLSSCIIEKRKTEGQQASLAAVVEKTHTDTEEKLLNSQTEETESAVTPEKMQREREQRLAGYGHLQAQNLDMKGWITVPGTRIDYPVMQTVDRPDYYLSHDFNKQESSHGVPYIAENCNLTGSGDIVIYGHHMKDGTMFTDLMKYTDEAYYRENPILWFDTIDETGSYVIIGVAKASALVADDPLLLLGGAGDEASRQKFLTEMKARAFYDTGQMAEKNEPLLVLVTCEYSQKEGRLLVAAKKIKRRAI